MAGSGRSTVLLQLWTAAHMAERLVAEHMERAGVSDEQFALLSRIALDGPGDADRPGGRDGRAAADARRCRPQARRARRDRAPAESRPEPQRVE
ncbi:MAG TPA: hypothetical protein VHQ98_05945 [Gaiellaceae bacterium]|nr:hypothetical protein [Gaiellaceae bacterium]